MPDSCYKTSLSRQMFYPTRQADKSFFLQELSVFLPSSKAVADSHYTARTNFLPASSSFTVKSML